MLDYAFLCLVLAVVGLVRYALWLRFCRRIAQTRDDAPAVINAAKASRPAFWAAYRSP